MKRIAQVRFCATTEGTPMHRSKPSRLRVLVPSALAVVILTGAAAPAGAADGGSAAALRKRVEAVKKEVDHRQATAPTGVLDDLLASVSATLDGLVKSLQTLLPGVTLPPIQLPTFPDLPEIPDLPIEIPGLPITLPPVGEAPEVPEIPEIPETPETPETPEIPEVPEITLP
ncbi:hypothetical protein AB0F11_04185 [Streptomyces sp. NPDC032472]|uniref:hypothetical protein n=1 Tax=Streptomyces sp. NPDC032472 TaxID=3155018 RepID=UPI0033F0F905